jgi:multicomponent Na+:H+ antiporter subunit D
MTAITISWIALPFFIGFAIFLIPKLDKTLAILGSIVSFLYGISIFVRQTSFTLQLLDNFGVTLRIDSLTGYFILTNAIVTLAVILYCWQSDKKAFFYAQMIIVHGSVNAAFACIDFCSLYVALEVSGIAAFLLIAYPRSDRSIWVALRYLFVSNTAMLFYLVGAVLVYKASHSLSFAGLKDAPPEAIALIFMGLLVKGGVFVSGLWLPLTHSESGVYPLVRCALMVEEVAPIIEFFGVATAILGVSYAVFEKDSKRMLAFHTVSQLGFILAAPAVGGLYGLAHGLVKSTLFLIAGNLPSRSFKELQKLSSGIDRKVWFALVIASLSISGFPFLVGFGAKVLTLKNLLPWQGIIMNVAAVGTAISFAKFIFLPRGDAGKVSGGFWLAVSVLVGGLFVTNAFYWEAYTLENSLKAIATIGIGWLAYSLIFQRLTLKLPRVLEQFEHLTGFMMLMLIPLFWMALTWSHEGL